MAAQIPSEPDNIFRIDRQDKLPLYEQIGRNLRELISTGRLQPGAMVPSEWELAGFYGVSRLTVRRALDDLVRQDWLSRRHGVGTFVRRPSVAAIAPIELSFTQQMLAIGRRPSSRLVSSRIVAANTTVAQRLSLNEGEPVVELIRLRLADEIPILHETAYLSSRRFPGIESDPVLSTESLYECMNNRYGVLIARIDQTFKAILLTDEQAALLDAEPNSPAVFSETLAYTAEGEAVEYTYSVANNQYSQFYFSFRRGV